MSSTQKHFLTCYTFSLPQKGINKISTRKTYRIWLRSCVRGAKFHIGTRGFIIKSNTNLTYSRFFIAAYISATWDFRPFWPTCMISHRAGARKLQMDQNGEPDFGHVWLLQGSCKHKCASKQRFEKSFRSVLTQKKNLKWKYKRCLHCKLTSAVHNTTTDFQRLLGMIFVFFVVEILSWGSIRFTIHSKFPRNIHG